MKKKNNFFHFTPTMFKYHNPYNELALLSASDCFYIIHQD